MKNLTLNIKVIGLGGIGTCLFPQLYIYLSYLKVDVHVTLIDGDVYESHNASRQFFDRRGHKAEVQYNLYKKMFPRITFSYHNEYIDKQRALYMIQDGDIVLMGVDNHVTRNLVSKYCEQLDNIVLISGGNELVDGDMWLQVKIHKQKRTESLASEHNPEILYPEDKHPEQMSCEELAKSEPQLLPTNLFVATTMINCLNDIVNKMDLQDRVAEYENDPDCFLSKETGILSNLAYVSFDYNQVYCDIQENATRPVLKEILEISGHWHKFS